MTKRTQAADTLSVRRRDVMHNVLARRNFEARDLEALDGIPQSAPPRPAGGSWPPSPEMRGWLNVVLDIKMRDDVDQYFEVVEKVVCRPPRDWAETEIREMLAIASASDNAAAALTELLHDPTHTTLSQNMRDYLAGRFAPRKSGPEAVRKRP